MFAEAQLKLQVTFGMEMRALPSKEKLTLKERRSMFSDCFVVGRIPDYIRLGRGRAFLLLSLHEENQLIDT